MKMKNYFWAVVCAMKRAQCRRRTKQWSPHPGAICPPVQSSPVQYERECVPRHTTVFAPNFLLPHHSLCANCTSRAPTLTVQSYTSHGRILIVHKQGIGAAYNIPTTTNCASSPDQGTGLRGRTFPPVILPFVLSQNGISTVAQPTGS